MSERNRSLPLALDHNSRLNNPVARHRKFKRPNAQKHGVFATHVIIPGEDRSEFEELLAELIDEWKPSGPTLRHALYNLADSMWRLRRLKKYVQTELYLHTFDPNHPAFNEAWGFVMFIDYLRSEPATCLENRARRYLRTDKINYLKQKFPRSNYQSASEWAEAVKTEIFSVLLPATPGFEPPALEGQGDRFKEVVSEAGREWRTDQQVAGSIGHARELLEYEDKETERLEARIAKQTRYCAELKALEEMRSKT